GVSGGDSRKYVLPSRRCDARADGAGGGLAEHRDEIVIVENLPLDFLGKRLSLGGIVGGEVAFVLGVELIHANGVGGDETAAFEVRLVPIGPARTDAGAGEDDIDPGPLLDPGLPPLIEDGAFEDLELAADADGLELRQNALAA